MSDENGISEKFLVGDPSITPNDEKLKQDALSLVSQYLHFWKPGEVECTVILSRPDSKRAVYGTSTMQRDRLLHILDSVRGESVLQSLLVQRHRRTR